MRQGEIWHVDLEPTRGKVIQGRRYVLVVSRDTFHKATGLALVCPITQGGASARHGGFTVALQGSGTKTQGVVLTNQIRTIDMTERSGKKVETAPRFVVDETITHIEAILGSH